MKRGQALSVPLAKCAEPSDIFASEQTRARAMFANLEMADSGEVPVLVAPFQSSAPEKLKSPMHAGADNSHIFCEWLGHSASELQRWTAAGVV